MNLANGLRVKLFSFVVLLLLLFGAIASKTLMQVPVKAASTTSVSSQLQALGASPSGVALQAEYSALLSDPNLATWANEVLAQGGTSLTGFQKDLLKIVIDTAPYSSIIVKKLNGNPLSPDEKNQAATLHNLVANNPAAQKLISVGAQLKGSNTLASYLSTDVSTLNAPPQIPSPTTGDAARDAIMSRISTIESDPNFTTFRSTSANILSDPAAPSYISTLHPSLIASYMPASQLIALLIPNDRDPALLDIVKASIEVIIGIAGIIVTVTTIPVALSVAFVAAMIASVGSLLLGIIDLGTAFDCDHDGDPWDANDAPGIECP